MKNIHFIVNKLSPQAKVIKEKVLKELDPIHFSITFKLSEYKGHTIELTKASVLEKADVVVACGGDGTINEVAQCLVHTETTLAILPVGSGNGLARHLQIPTEISKAIKRLIRFQQKKIDVGQANERYFFCNISFAFSAQVIHCYDDLTQRGFRAYSRALLKAILAFRYRSFGIRIPNETIRSTPFVLMISNTDQMGYNRTLTPDASLFDGKLDVIRVERYNPLLLGFFMLFAFFRKFPPFTKVHRRQLEEITLSCENAPVNIQIDGEKLISEDQSTHIIVLPKALKVIC